MSKIHKEYLGDQLVMYCRDHSNVSLETCPYIKYYEEKRVTCNVCGNLNGECMRWYTGGEGLQMHFFCIDALYHGEWKEYLTAGGFLYRHRLYEHGVKICDLF